jgi:hypothetical protein
LSSNASFRVAAKHLFRHLHDARALRKNPLVRQLFENHCAGGSARARESAVLARLHDLVRQGSDDCRDADLAEGKDDRAVRQHAIVALQCLEQRPIAEVAAALGISYGHCYRERAEICRRIARYICEHSTPLPLEYLPELDEFHVRMDRARHRSAIGDARAAIRECDALVRVAPSAQYKIEALRLSAIVSLRFGIERRAEQAHLAARALLREMATQPTAAQDVARACIDLIEARLAYYRADETRAMQMALAATQRLEPVSRGATLPVRELLAEGLFELGSALCNAGKLGEGYECVSRSERTLREAHVAASPLHARIAIALWKLRDDLLMNSQSWYPSWQRVKGLTMAFEQAYATGSLAEAACALVALAEYYSVAGNDAETLRSGRFALLIAKQEGSTRILAQTALRVAIALQSTRYRESAGSLLPRTRQLDACDAYHREMLTYFSAQRALQRSSYQDAWALTRTEENRRETASLRISRRLIAATAAHELERRDAYDLIEAAIPAAENLGSAPILKDTYTVAARITGSPRFKRQAHDLARLLTA